MPECKHKFVKFDEDRIFCERCGLFMLAARYAPTYVPAPTYWAPRPWYGTFIWNGTSPSVTGFSTAPTHVTAERLGNMTYTLNSGSGDA